MDEEPVEILVRMAESGEIDPWNIDIVEVTDRFLSELERMQKLDLRISGRTLFFASTLLRMKSEYLDEPEVSEPDTEGNYFEDEYGFDDDDEYSFGAFAEPIDRLEREIQRRIKRKKQRKRPVTLFELIKELKTAEKMQRRRQRRKSPEPAFFFEADDIVNVAHEEDFEDIAETIFSCFEDMEAEAGNVSLSDICQRLGRDVRTIYIPLLYLMLERRIILKQEEFFGEIYLTRWQAEAFND
ncbi:MAG: segregation/condensation protein A [Methanomicrobiaceae archaeon]|nr:segregation/condensation protein A [Methanomicrobiaceae archaeon]